MSSDPVVLEIAASGVATVTLARPEVHNAFDDALIARLAEILDELGASRAARVVVLRSEGRSFSAGADLEWMRRMAGYSEERNHADALALAHMLRRLASLRQPTVAAVQGAAFGGGAGLVACCDIVVASGAARFSFSEVKLGLIPATISPFVLRAIGARRARALFLTGEVFGAEVAERIGLVHRVVEAESLESATGEVASSLAGYGRQTLAAIGALVDHVDGRALDGGLLEETAARIAAQRASAEGREGIAAFLDKRPPRWPEDDGT